MINNTKISLKKSFHILCVLGGIAIVILCSLQHNYAFVGVGGFIAGNAMSELKNQ